MASSSIILRPCFNSWRLLCLGQPLLVHYLGLNYLIIDLIFDLINFSLLNIWKNIKLFVHTLLWKFQTFEMKEWENISILWQYRDIYLFYYVNKFKQFISIKGMTFSILLLLNAILIRFISTSVLNYWWWSGYFLMILS